jgi:hypothetical protein
MCKSQKHREMIAMPNQQVSELSRDLLGTTRLAAKASQGEALGQVQAPAMLMDKVVTLTKDGIELDRRNVAAREETETSLVQAASPHKPQLGAPSGEREGSSISAGGIPDREKLARI